MDYFIDSAFIVLLFTTLEKQNNALIGLLREVMEDDRTTNQSANYQLHAPPVAKY